eukprot:COSAG02_NODE_24234_length_694_cov_1.043697_2_plen_30_part_01
MPAVVLAKSAVSIADCSRSTVCSPVLEDLL